MNTRIRNFIKLSTPYGLLSLINQRHERKWLNRKWYHFWQGSLLKNVECKHLFFDKKMEDIFYVMQQEESRIAVRIKSNDTLKIGPLLLSQKYIQFGISLYRKEAQVRDLKIFLNNNLVSYLKGTMESSRWIDIRIPLQEHNMFYDVKIQYSGSSELFFANPIIGMKEKNRDQNFIILMLDALIPPHLGYQKNDSKDSVTPYIDHYFSSGRIYENCFSQGDWTLPSVNSMFTGLYPSQHGVVNPGHYGRKIPSQIPTLGELLKGKGYHTFCFSTVRRLLPSYGHQRGFDRFLYSQWHTTENSSGRYIVNSAIEFIESHYDEPFFLLLHFNESHPPYGKLSYFSNTQLSPYRLFSAVEGCEERKYKKNNSLELKTEIEHIGTAKLRQLDLFLSCLFNYLNQRGLDRNTTVFLTSDHGWNFRDDAPVLKLERVHIPLLIKGPTIKEGRIKDIIEVSVDLYPTILKLADISFPEHIVGRDILEESVSRKYAISESCFKGIYEISIRDFKWCYIYRCEMDSSSGEIFKEKILGEYLFERDKNDGREDCNSNVACHHPKVIADFKKEVEKICLYKRFF